MNMFADMTYYFDFRRLAIRLFREMGNAAIICAGTLHRWVTFIPVHTSTHINKWSREYPSHTAPLDGAQWSPIVHPYIFYSCEEAMRFLEETDIS